MKVIKKNLRKVIAYSKRKYFHDFFNECTTNIRKSWLGMKNLMGSSTSSKTRKINPIRVNNDICYDHQTIANEFNSYFCSVAHELEAEIPHVQNGDLNSPIIRNPCSLFINDITETECSTIIANLKNTRTGTEKMSAVLLKKVRDLLSSPIAFLINKSFASGYFPDELKKACVTPIFKAGDTSITNNYRPISVLPLLAKIIEKCMHNRLTTFFEQCSILSESQYGFKKGVSCSDAIVSLTEFIYKSLNEKKFVITLFMDLKKAYDTVNHDILLKKLEAYGIRGEILKWFESYLSDRKQRVKIGEVYSEWKSITIGVPQGSVLGSLLFLVYINDLPLISPMFHTVLFADDTCLTLADENYSSLMENFNSELENVYAWLIANRLSLNFEKTVCINFSTRKYDDDSPLVLNGLSFTSVNKTKYLGVIIDKNLSFSHHIEYVSNKLSKNIGILYRLSSNSPSYIVRQVYHAIVLPYLSYCNVIWGGTAKCHLDKLLILQKRAVRIVSNAGYRDHTEPLFKSESLLNIYKLYKFMCCLYVFKKRDNYQLAHNVYDTRNSYSMLVTFQRLTTCKKSIYYSAPPIFNTIPTERTSILSLNKFKSELKNYLIHVDDTLP